MTLPADCPLTKSFHIAPALKSKPSICFVPQPFESLAILAPGLLGGSLGMAVHDRGLAKRITVWARRSEIRLACRETHWRDEAFASPIEAARDADAVVICTPVSRIVALALEVAPVTRPGAIITDVGSTKSLICREISHQIPPDRFFVGSHPMAGSEKTGLENAQADLFEGRTCFITPPLDTTADHADRIGAFWRALGMDIVTASPEDHDEIVAHISHLPHIIASALCCLLAEKNPAWIDHTGNGFRDTTRIAAGNPALWRDILLQNREEILRAINGMESALHRFKSALNNEESISLKQLFEDGKRYRDRLEG